MKSFPRTLELFRMCSSALYVNVGISATSWLMLASIFPAALSLFKQNWVHRIGQVFHQVWICQSRPWTRTLPEPPWAGSSAAARLLPSCLPTWCPETFPFLVLNPSTPLHQDEIWSHVCMNLTNITHSSTHQNPYHYIQDRDAVSAQNDLANIKECKSSFPWRKWTSRSSTWSHITDPLNRDTGPYHYVNIQGHSIFQSVNAYGWNQFNIIFVENYQNAETMVPGNHSTTQPMRTTGNTPSGVVTGRLAWTSSLSARSTSSWSIHPWLIPHAKTRC